jgi:hypothetical protein
MECAEEALERCEGIVKSDRGYCSESWKNWLVNKGLGLIVLHRKNKAPNAVEEKSLL